MDLLYNIISTIGVIVFMVCLLILFGPIFIGLHRIANEPRSTAATVELFTYPLEEAPTDYIDVEFTVITE